MKIIFGTLVALVCLRFGYLLPNWRPLQYPKEELKILLDSSATCAKELGTLKGYPQRAIELLSTQSYEDSEAFKDFLYCSSVKAGFYTENGKPISEYLNKLFKDDDVRVVLKQCAKSVSEERPKDLVFKYYTCYLQNSPALLVF